MSYMFASAYSFQQNIQYWMFDIYFEINFVGMFFSADSMREKFSDYPGYANTPKIIFFNQCRPSSYSEKSSGFAFGADTASLVL